MSSTSLITSAGQLRDSFAGAIVLPNEVEYTEARAAYNSMIDRRPAVIAQCATVGDVGAAVRLARQWAVPVAVRGGGHSVAGLGTCDGGVVIDLRHMNSVTVNTSSRTATVAGGATIGDLDRATQSHALATTGGRVSTTGVGGLALGGGTGWLDRKFGLASDNLISVDLVTADGSCVTASEDQNAELFWALHGGGGNFGVATSLSFRLHNLPAITAGVLLWPPEQATNVLAQYRDFMATAPDEASGAAIFGTGPDAEFVPPHLRGRLSLLVVVVYAGPRAQAEEAFAPLLSVGSHGGFLRQIPYVELQTMFDVPAGARHYWSAQHLSSLPDEAIEVMSDAADQMLVPSLSELDLYPGGGAAARQRLDDPIPWRTAPWVAHPFGVWESPVDDDLCCNWAQRARDSLAPWSTGAVYLNFIGHEGDSRVRAGYGDENYTRLANVKADYDPDNVFRFNHNVVPVRSQAQDGRVGGLGASTSARP